jgi:hypothetical protein
VARSMIDGGTARPSTLAVLRHQEALPFHCRPHCCSWPMLLS